MNTQIQNFLASHTFAPSTKAKYQSALQLLIPISDLEHLSPADLLVIVQKPEWGNSQQSLALYAAHGFLRWLYGPKHPALTAKLKRIKSPPRRCLSPNQALQLLASFNPWTPKGARDLGIVAFALDTAFRSTEICRMQLANLDFYANTAKGLVKGGQWRFAALSPLAIAILQDWLRFRRPADGVGNLFVNIKTGKALTRDGLGSIFKEWSRSLGFQISPHDLRSSSATLGALFGMSSRAGMIAGGWKSMEEYEHYTATLQLDAARPFLPMANLTKL